MPELPRLLPALTEIRSTSAAAPNSMIVRGSLLWMAAEWPRPAIRSTARAESMPRRAVGTGFFGGSSVGENLQPAHFVQWTRLAYNSDPAEAFGNFSGLIPWETPAGPVPPYPFASNMGDAGGRRDGHPSPAHRTPLTGTHPGAPAMDPMGAGGGGRGPETATSPGLQGQDLAGLREEIRRLVIEELSQLVGGERRG